MHLKKEEDNEQTKSSNDNIVSIYTMSQSDYIKYLKLATELKNQTTTDFPPVLDSQNYTLFKDYTIVNTVKNTVPLYNELKSSTNDDIFGLSLKSRTNCPSFLLCNGTNARPNRVKLLSVQITPRPTNDWIKQPKNTQCSACCYDVSPNSNIVKKLNYYNTNFTTCANEKLVKMKCHCSRI